MSGNTGIQWTDKTWNPVVGCTKVAPECKFCYAKTVHDMRHKAFLEGKPLAPQYAEPFETVQLKPERLQWPLSLRKPARIFVNSVSDLFHEDVPDEFIDKVFTVMAQASRHTFQILTKRPARMKAYMQRMANIGLSPDGKAPERGMKNFSGVEYPWPLPNVEVGVSAGTQKAWDENVPELLETPAAVRFVSMEPLLEAVNVIDVELLHWIIVGGESGTLKQKVRPMDPAWVIAIRTACASWGIPFFFKQWGEWLLFVGDNGLLPDGDGRARVDGKTYPASRVQVFDHFYRVRVGTKRAGRMLDGVEHNAFAAATVARTNLEATGKIIDLMEALKASLKP